GVNSLKNGKAFAAVVIAAIVLSGAGAVSAAQAKNDTQAFLVASPEMLDPLFRESVILMLPRTNELPLITGVIVNKPAGVPLRQLAPDSGALKNRSDTAYFGGPVDLNAPALVFQSAHPAKGATQISGDIYFSLDPEFVAGMLKSNPIPSHLRLYFGRAQWAPGQLQDEMHAGAWYVVRAAPGVIFSAKPKRLWRRLIDRAQMRSIIYRRILTPAAGGR
ncbi:MAG: YqgE/AlgH family protein, partial [Candidatus Binataceae bacterium]